MITRAIQNCLNNAQARHWEKVYWAFDVHGTILKPTFQRGVLSTEFYPHAMEAMQLVSQQQDIVRILYTYSYPEEIVEYVKFFEARGIHFDYVNENPEVGAGAYGYYESKFYFNVLFEDKAGFDPLTDWQDILDLLNQRIIKT
jgi:hypothetical protein